MKPCWMIEQAQSSAVTIVYVQVLNSAHYEGMARRFVASYHQHAPDYAHRTLIMVNNGLTSPASEAIFAGMPRCSFVNHDNSGKDIGAFQHAARISDCELMVFFGGSTYFRRAGWLRRMVEAYHKFGPTLYGSTGNRGMPQIHVFPHIRTTAFWLPPSLMNQYPHKVTQDNQRYPFEHGPQCLTDWISRRGMVPLVVSWDGEYSWENWDDIPNGYHRGDQSNVLVGDRLTEAPYYHTP